MKYRDQYSPEEHIKIRKLHKEGATIHEIYAALKPSISLRTFRAHLNAFGLRFAVSSHEGTSKISQPDYVDPWEARRQQRQEQAS